MADQLVTCWLETRLGARYEIPDMSPQHVDSVCRQLDGDSPHITVANTSEVVCIIPKRIIAKAGAGNRCFWEVACTKLNPPGEYQKD